MSNQDHKARPIRATKAAEFSRWRMPEMTKAQRTQLIALAQRAAKKPVKEPVEVVEEPLHAEKLTVAEWEAIREEARQEGLAQGRKEGIAEGREQGLKQGLDEGLAQAAKRIQQQLDGYHALLGQLQDPLKEQEEELHQLILKLVLRVSSALVEAEFAQRTDLILDTIKQALDMVPPGAGTPVLSMHPEDCAQLQRYADLQGWELRENPDAKRGDLKLVAGSCVINSELEQKVLQVAENLLQGASGNTADDAN